MHEEFGDKIYGFTLCYKSKADAWGFMRLQFTKYGSSNRLPFKSTPWDFPHKAILLKPINI